MYVFCGILQAALRQSYTLQLGDPKVKKMVQDKSIAEASVKHLLQQFDGHVRQKLDLCKQRQQQQHSIHTSLTTASKYLMLTDPAPATLGWSADQAMQQNTSQLQTYIRLAASYQETQQATERLQQCIQKEEQLMSELAKPLQTCLRASMEVLEEIHANMHVDFEGPEQKHAENLTRYVQIKFPLELQLMYIKNIVALPYSVQSPVMLHGAISLTHGLFEASRFCEAFNMAIAHLFWKLHGISFWEPARLQ